MQAIQTDAKDLVSQIIDLSSGGAWCTSVIVPHCNVTTYILNESLNRRVCVRELNVDAVEIHKMFELGFVDANVTVSHEEASLTFCALLWLDRKTFGFGVAGPIAPLGEGDPLMRYSSCLDHCRASIVRVSNNQFCVLTGVIGFEAPLASVYTDC